MYDKGTDILQKQTYTQQYIYQRTYTYINTITILGYNEIPVPANRFFFLIRTVQENRKCFFFFSFVFYETLSNFIFKTTRLSVEMH